MNYWKSVLGINLPFSVMGIATIEFGCQGDCFSASQKSSVAAWDNTSKERGNATTVLKPVVLSDEREILAEYIFGDLNPIESGKSCYLRSSSSEI